VKGGKHSALHDYQFFCPLLMIARCDNPIWSRRRPSHALARAAPTQNAQTGSVSQRDSSNQRVRVGRTLWRVLGGWCELKRSPLRRRVACCYAPRRSAARYASAYRKHHISQLPDEMIRSSRTEKYQQSASVQFTRTSIRSNASRKRIISHHCKLQRCSVVQRPRIIGIFRKSPVFELLYVKVMQCCALQRKG
jgi:hypothetical protein